MAEAMAEGIKKERKEVVTSPEMHALSEALERSKRKRKRIKGELEDQCRAAYIQFQIIEGLKAEVKSLRAALRKIGVPKCMPKHLSEASSSESE